MTDVGDFSGRKPDNALVNKNNDELADANEGQMRKCDVVTLAKVRHCVRFFP